MNYRDKTLRLADLVDDHPSGGLLKGHRFENCTLKGPAVLFDFEQVSYEGCDLGPHAAHWVSHETRISSA